MNEIVYIDDIDYIEKEILAHLNNLDNLDELCEIMTRNLFFDMLNFEYLYKIDKNNFLYDLGVFSILINFELHNGIYKKKEFTLLVDLKFLNQSVSFNMIVVDNVDNLTGVFKVNNYTYFNINMKNRLLESVKIDDLDKLNNYIENDIKVKDSLCFWFSYTDLDIYRCYSNISNLAHIHTEICIDIVLDMELDLLNIILVLKRLYDSLLGLTKTIYYCKLSVICHDVMFNFESEALKIYLKKLLNYFDIVNIEFINTEKKIYTFN